MTSVNVNLNFLSFCHRYYDQLEAMEGKFPISESQVNLNFSLTGLHVFLLI